MNQTSPNFTAELEQAIKELEPTVMFECVGGDLPGVIFEKMPVKSVMVVYGNLSHQKISFEPGNFHWADK